MSEAEELVSCPYDKSHSILLGRMQFHLKRCRLQHKNTGLVYCPYNSSHVIPQLELEFHQKICKSRIVLDSFLYKVGDDDCRASNTVAINEMVLPPSEENWDEDGVEYSILDTIKERAKDKCVLLNLIAKPKAERKAHRINERNRFQKLMNGIPDSDVQHQPTEKTLRQPKKSGVYDPPKDVRLPNKGRSTIQLLHPLMGNTLNDNGSHKKEKSKSENTSKMSLKEAENQNICLADNENEDHIQDNFQMAENLLEETDVKPSRYYKTSQLINGNASDDFLTLSTFPSTSGQPIPRSTFAACVAARPSKDGSQTTNAFLQLPKQNSSNLITHLSFAGRVNNRNSQINDVQDVPMMWGHISNKDHCNQSKIYSDFPGLPISGRGRGRKRNGY